MDIESLPNVDLHTKRTMSRRINFWDRLEGPRGPRWADLLGVRSPGNRWVRVCVLARLETNHSANILTRALRYFHALTMGQPLCKSAISPIARSLANACGDPGGETTGDFKNFWRTDEFPILLLCKSSSCKQIKSIPQYLYKYGDLNIQLFKKETGKRLKLLCAST